MFQQRMPHAQQAARRAGRVAEFQVRCCILLQPVLHIMRYRTISGIKQNLFVCTAVCVSK